MSAFFTIPEAIQFQKDYDWNTVQQSCKKRIKDFRDTITNLTGLPKLCPDDWLGQMATILFPMADVDAFKNTLYDDYKIEIPTMAANGKSAFRISIQGYNSEADVDQLIDVLKNMI